MQYLIAIPLITGLVSLAISFWAAPRIKEDLDQQGLSNVIINILSWRPHPWAYYSKQPMLPKFRGARLIERVGTFGVGAAFLLVAAKGLMFENWLGIEVALPYDLGTAGLGFVLGVAGSFVFAQKF